MPATRGLNMASRLQWAVPGGGGRERKSSERRGDKVKGPRSKRAKTREHMAENSRIV